MSCTSRSERTTFSSWVRWLRMNFRRSPRNRNLGIKKDEFEFSLKHGYILFIRRDPLIMVQNNKKMFLCHSNPGLPSHQTQRPLPITHILRKNVNKSKQTNRIIHMKKLMTLTNRTKTIQNQMNKYIFSLYRLMGSTHWIEYL